MRPKKIILICIDALRADHLGFYGYRRNTSPNLDILTKESVLFSWAFSACSYTVPAHASMLTGKYPSNHTFGFVQGWPTGYSPDKEIMLQEVLSSIGYETAAFVSGFPMRKETGLSNGFRVYDDEFTRSELNRPEELVRDGSETNLKIFSWLNEKGKENFFLFIHYFDVHGPYTSPEGFNETFLEDEFYTHAIYLDIRPDYNPVGGIPAYQVLKPVRSEYGILNSFEKDSRYYIAQYDACIRYVDRAIADVVAKLKELRIYDECLLIVTADHGEAMGENNVWFYHSLTVTPDQIHVPFIIKPHRGWSVRPKTIKTQVTLVDIFSTISELAGFDYSDLGIDGKSLIRLIEKGRDEELEARTLIAEIEGQIAHIDDRKIDLKPKQVDRSKLVFFYVEELCNKELSIEYRRENTMLEWTGERYVPWMEQGEIHYEHLHRYRFARELVKGKKVLDLACGEGYGSLMLSEEAGEVTGIDIDETTIRHASSKYLKENLKFLKGSITDIPIKDERIFDVIVCFEALEHIEEHDKLLKEVKRLLKADGTFIVSTPNKYIYADQPNYQNPFHLKELYFDEFKDLLSKNFKSVLLYGQKVYPSSNIFPLYKESGPMKDFSIEKGDKEFLFVPPDKKLAKYFIAVTSDSSMDKNLVLGNSYLLDLSETLLHEKDARISHLGGLVSEKDGELGSLKDTISQRDAHISHLEGVVREREVEIGSLQETMNQKAIQISHLGGLVSEKDGELGSLKDTISQRDAHISHLEGVVREREVEAEDLKVNLAEKEREIGSLNEVVSQRDSRVLELTDSLSKRDTVIEGLNKGLRQRDVQISRLEGLVREKEKDAEGLRITLEQKGREVRSLNETIVQKDVQISHLRLVATEKEATLNHIYNSHGWKALLFYYGVRDKIFPANTKRRLFGKIILNALRKPKGFSANFNKSSLRKFIYYLKNSEPTVLEEKITKKLNNTTEEIRKREAGFHQESALNHSPRIKKQNNQSPDEDYFNFLFEMKTKKSKDYVPISYPNIPEINVKLIAFYLPQFHPIPENDEWWGKGFTDWTNVTSAVPQFVGHYQPRLPGELGFYDLRITEVLKRQIQLARQYGIYGFCFHFYWFDGGRLLEHPLEAFLSNRELNFPFCLNWANENWTRRWDGLDSEILIAQNHSPEDDIAFIEYVSKYLRDKRYIRIGSKPLLIVYRPSLLPDPQKTAERWREWCHKNGIGEIYLTTTHSFEHVDPSEIGFDAAVEFAPNTFPLRDITNEVKVVNPIYEGKIFDYRGALDFARNYEKPSYKKFRGICPGWDNEARRSGRGNTLANSSPEAYKEWLKMLCDFTMTNFDSQERLIFINAWNEWAEAAYLEPDRKYGYAYLNNTAEVISSFAKEAVASIGKWKILFVSHDACRGGAQSVLLNIISWFKKHTFLDLKILCLDGGEWLHRFRELGDTLVLSELRKRTTPKEDILRKLVEFCGGSPDLIYGNSVASGREYLLLHQLKSPIITHFHELEMSIMRYAADWMGDVLKHSSHFIAISRAVQENLEKKHGVDLFKITTVHSSLNTNSSIHVAGKSEKRELRKKFGLEENKFLVFGCGIGMVFRKGADLFIEVAHILRRNGFDDFHFYWIGDFDNKESDERYGIWADHFTAMKKDGLDRYVTFLGLKDNPREYLQAGDLFLVPSREEPLGLVALEAAECGLPTVCFADAGGTPEIVEQDVGFVVPYEDVDAMAAKVALLMRDDNLRLRLGIRAREKLLSHFTTEQLTPRIFSACRKAASKKPAVSVIVPNYNHARYLPRRLDSIFKQTFKDFEVILLDDASTDHSMDVLERYAIYPDVRIIRNERNSGSPFIQWLKGIDLARSDILWIAESDDACEPQFLETMLPVFRNPALKLAYADSHVIDENDRVTGDYSNGEYLTSLSPTKWKRSYQVAATEEINDGLGVKDTILNVSAALFRKFEFGDEFRKTLENMHIAGDWYFIVHAIKDGQIHYLADKLNYHRRHSASVISQVVSGKRLNDFYQEFHTVQQFITQNYKLDSNFYEKWDTYMHKQWNDFCQNRPFDELKSYYPVDEMKYRILSNAGALTGTIDSRENWREHQDLYTVKHESDSGHCSKEINVSQKVSQPDFDDELIPPTKMMFDGATTVEDFKNIGEGFTRYFLIEHAKLNRSDKVLDVGCGIGQKARALAKYLDRDGVYEGFDIVPQGINWCKEKYQRYPNFHFHLADIYNKFYNPNGKLRSSQYKFPYADDMFDLVFLSSVFTHMLPEDMSYYLSEIVRVLRQQSRCVITFFLLNWESLKGIDAKLNTIQVPFKYSEVCRINNRDTPETTVAYDEMFIRDLFLKSGLSITEVTYGSWSGRKEFNNILQDVIIAVKV